MQVMEMPDSNDSDVLSKYSLINSMEIHMKRNATCRICDTQLPEPYLDLGITPLANSYLLEHSEIQHEERYELAVTLCPTCMLSQLTVVVPPGLMFKHYLYVSSTTQTFRSHCSELAENVLKEVRVGTNPVALDIGSNDGCLLSKFRELGAEVVGVDPAENLSAEANAKGIKTINSYWGDDAAAQVARIVGNPDVITATNVFAHVDCIHDFLRCVTNTLQDTGLFVFEVPYFVDLVQKCEFDTIYHEHLSYFLLKPIQRAVSDHGLRVIDVQHHPIHGGTIRVFVAKVGSGYSVRSSVGEMLAAEEEMGFYDRAVYESFANTVAENKSKMLALVKRLAAEGKRIAGYGAAAKGNTLLNYYGLDCKNIKFICDDNQKKHGYLTPGSHIPIVGPSSLSTSTCEYLLLLAWNFSDEIKRRTKLFQDSGGRYICPVPDLVIE